MPNQNLPTASVSISFSVEAIDEETGLPVSHVLQAEVNQDDNDGQSRFTFGGTAPIFRIYRTDSIKSVMQFPTDGSISGAGSGETTVTEVVIFSNSNTARTRYPIRGGFSAEAMGGANLGTISPIGSSNQIQCSKTSSGPTDPIVGAYKVSYKTNFTKHRLGGVSKPSGFGEEGFDNYPVHIHLVGIV